MHFQVAAAAIFVIFTFLFERHSYPFILFWCIKRPYSILFYFTLQLSFFSPCFIYQLFLSYIFYQGLTATLLSFLYRKEIKSEKRRRRVFFIRFTYIYIFSCSRIGPRHTHTHTYSSIDSDSELETENDIVPYFLNLISLLRSTSTFVLDISILSFPPPFCF